MLGANSVPGERCPASQEEGLKLEHSSDLSTNVTGECSPLPALTYFLESPVHLTCFSSDVPKAST